MEDVYFRFKQGNQNVQGSAIKGKVNNGAVTGIEYMHHLVEGKVTIKQTYGNRYQITFHQGIITPPHMVFVETAPRITYDTDFNLDQPRVLGSSNGTPGFLEAITKQVADKMIEAASNFDLMRAWVCS